MNNEWDDLSKMVGLEPIPEDKVLPDGFQHIIYIDNVFPTPGNTASHVPIIINGFQWDMLWWVYRLFIDNEKDKCSYDHFYSFLHDYLRVAYENYAKKKID